MSDPAAALALAATACAVWTYLLAARGGFWRARQRDELDKVALSPRRWPAVVAVVPARDEVEVVAQSIGSLLGQCYPGRLSVILVDDHSTDGTCRAARAAAVAAQAGDRLTVIAGAALAPGWTGKLWAVEQGVRHTAALPELPDYLLLTDADIAYADDALRQVVARAEHGQFVLTSLMAKLRCESGAERSLIPAFIFFFQMLYPFAWVNRAELRTAAAAGGCMLVRYGALRAVGGMESIRGQLIDDCALARLLKAQGPIWLGLTERVRSLRPCGRVGDVRRMVARTAYAQLRESPLLLAATVLGMGVTYLVPPLLALFGSGAARAIATATWVMMASAFLPTLRFYGRSSWWAPALPAIAFVYMLFTLDSAVQHWRGRGGMWKGRAQSTRLD